MKNISENTELLTGNNLFIFFVKIMQIVTNLWNDVIILVKIKEKVTLPIASHDGL